MKSKHLPRFLLLLLLGIQFSFHWITAQNLSPSSCGSDYLHSRLLNTDPNYAARQQSIDNDILNRTLNPGLNQAMWSVPHRLKPPFRCPQIQWKQAPRS